MDDGTVWYRLLNIPYVQWNPWQNLYGAIQTLYKFDHLSQKKPKKKKASWEKAVEKLSTSKENPNSPKNTTNREESTKFSIE